MPFNVRHESAPGVCVVRLTGDIDIAVVPELREDLNSALGGGCNNVVLDLNEVTYADSSALGLLVWLDHRLRPAGGRLVLAGANRDVTRILELSGLVQVAASIAMSANVDAALEGLRMEEPVLEPLWERSLQVPGSVDRLGDVREQVCDLLEPLHFPDSALFDIKVALGEALANAIRHGAPAVGEGVIGVRVVAYADRVVIEVEDNGAGFDGSHSPEGDLYAPSGRGIMFMRALTDRVEFEESSLGGTLVRLVKHRSAVAPAEKD